MNHDERGSQRHPTEMTSGPFPKVPDYNYPKSFGEGITRFAARMTSVNRKYNAPGTHILTLREHIGNGILQVALLGLAAYGATHNQNLLKIPEGINLLYRLGNVTSCLNQEYPGATWFPSLRRASLS